MKQKIEIIDEIQPTLESDRVILKVPYTQTDEFGTEATLYRKEYVTREGLLAQKQSIQDTADKQIAEIDEKLAAIDK